MDKKKKGIILSILGILGLIMITVGVSYAIFSYIKKGTTENAITTGSITFLYTEVSGVGNGISIENAFPISDEIGKVATGEGEYFDFKITSDTMGETSIPYEVTARKKADSTLDEEAVRIYLTDSDNNEELLLDNYSNLTQTSKVDSTKHIEKTIYTDRVPANTEDYEKNFRLRMWIDENIDFSQNEDGTYPYNGKTFTITVNVYANAKVITADEEELLQNANISSVSIDGTELTEVQNESYNYEMTLPAGTTETELDIVTENEYATVSVEKIDSLTYSNNIKRLSAKKTVDVVSGNNYFKITVTSENKEVIKEYKLKITVLKDTDNTLKSLSLTDCPLNEEFSSDVTSYTCTVQNNVDKTTVSAEATSSLATVTGTGEQSLVTGDNTITVTVTSESGEDKTYTITVTKPAGPMTATTALSVGTAVTGIDGSKWHVLEASASGTETVVLLSDYNLSTDGSYNTSCGQNINSSKACSLMVFDSDETNTYDETDSNNIGYFIKNTYEPLVTSSLPGTTNVTIPTAYQLVAVDGIEFDETLNVQPSLTSAWLATTQYWTKTKNYSYGSKRVWFVVNSAIAYQSASDASWAGARPVITTPKTNLLAE